uniref:EF-hand domain-containing protein n=1 Tax=viral metagenome TaxID=1070528 RepID=A0A6C0JX29_9ZZZZ
MRIIDRLNKFANTLNTNTYFAGITMLILNIGSKYIDLGFTKTQEQVIREAIARELIIFSILFVATKNVMVSILMTASFTILSRYLINENSSYCIMSSYMSRLSNAIDTNEDGVITKKEEEEAIHILEKAKRQKKKEVNKSRYDPYVENENIALY